ncbi:hypothetical protein BG006_006745 [Podila minutissima]|uniref:Rab-GAP TBC domain-containing protein n=1 Tax=Podila minutissima TaxID=64525 RepID=A0A9P5VL82_9FUNG|nr:hypothetical protein BG006_006745 [Podila minutissima]
MESYMARIEQFERHLAQNSDDNMICQREFRELCFGGIPDKPGLRQTCWKSFVKDLIVEPELGDVDLSLEDEESLKAKDKDKWTGFFQDNRTLEQIDKDVRRTLPDFAFFQLPIPYSPLCPLSIEPKTRNKKTPPASIEQEQTSTPLAFVEGAVPSPTGKANVLTPRRLTLQGSIDSRRGSLGARALTPTLKRRQTVTLMSPMADKIREKMNDLEPWSNAIKAPESGCETPPYVATANGFKTPNNYASPVLSKLRGMTAAVADQDVSEEAPLPDYLFSPIPTRRSLFKRVAHLNQDFGSREHQPHSLQASRTQENWLKKRRAQGEKRANGTPRSLSPEPPQSTDEASAQDELPQDLHWEAIERVLFIYAKLNPGVGYVQGMNEILGPMYYLLANDTDEASRAHAEAESFWLFHLLMAHFRDHFVRSLDRDRTSGIGSTIARMNFRLRQFDDYLWQNLEDKGIAPEYYSFRWLTVLCTQEFDVPDVWRIWDSVLADTGGVERDYDFLLDFGCAMVCHLRTELLGGDFADNVKLLQNYPPVDIQPILYLATVVRDERVSKNRPSAITRNSSCNNSFSNGTFSSDTHESAPSAQQHQSRPSIDLRIWSSRSSAHDAPLTSSSDNVFPTDLKALTIDGVQNSDRLDHNLEGIDHRSPLYTPNSNFRDNPHQTNVSRSGGGLPGLNLEGIWSRNAAPGRSSSRPVSTRERRHPSPSSLSVDNYVLTGRESRPQTGTWAEAFSQFKARLVGTGNSPDQGAVATLPTVAPGEGVGALSPSAEI